MLILRPIVRRCGAANVGGCVTPDAIGLFFQGVCASYGNILGGEICGTQAGPDTAMLIYTRVFPGRSCPL